MSKNGTMWRESTFARQNVKKIWVRATFASYDVQKCDAAVAPSTFASQNVQKTIVLDPIVSSLIS